MVKKVVKNKKTDGKISLKEKPKPQRDPKTGRITKGVAQETNKHATAGAPTKYEARYCQEMIDFFKRDKCRKELIEESIIQGKYGPNITKKWKYFANDTPFFEAFARKIGVEYRTLYNWAFAKDEDNNIINPDFFQAYNTCKQLQYEFLIDNGLAGLYPPASFIFVAKNITGMKDSSELKVKKGKPESEEIDDDELEAAIFG